MDKDVNIEDISDFDLINEISARMLESEVLQNVSTSDLEDELSSRIDSTFTDIKDLDEQDLYHLLTNIKKHNYNTKKEIISEALGFYNSFAYTIDEAIEELKKVWEYDI